MRIAPRLLLLVTLLALGRTARADLPPRPPPKPPAPPAPTEPPAPAPPAPAPAPAAEKEAGRLGFQPVLAEKLDDADRKARGIVATSGNVLVEVTPGGPAYGAGLRVGDVVLSVRGEAVPAMADDRWGPAWREMMARIKVGDVVGIEARRGEGDKVEMLKVQATAVTTETIEHLRADAAVKALPPFPALASAGEPQDFNEDFESVVLQGAIPAGFFPSNGRWSVVAGPEGSPSRRVLRQDLVVETWAVALLAGKGRATADGKVTVRFCPVSGREDASAGIVFRAQDAKNYYLTRANALEGNFRLYSVKDDTRWPLASIDLAPPALGTWHTLSVEFVGSKLKATLDGKQSVEAEDKSFASGWSGLWTKADSVTLFDDVSVVRLTASGVPAK